MSILEENINIEYYILKKFEFSTGEILQDLTVEYMTFGTPIKNEKGEIRNGIIFCHGAGEKCTSIIKLHEIIDNKKAIDTEKYFIISITALGSPNSHCPSNSNLGPNFPNYTIEDIVNFQKEFIDEKFNIKYVKGLIGNSMGGFEVLTWAINFPDYMDFIITLVSSYKFAGHNYILTKNIIKIIKNDPNYNNGYYTLPLKSIGIANQIDYPFDHSFEYYRNLSYNEIDNDLTLIGSNFKSQDGNDIILLNNALCSYDIEDNLHKIKSKTLIIAINQDLCFPPELDAIPMSEMIKNSKLIKYDSILGHFGIIEIAKVENDLKEFLSQF